MRWMRAIPILMAAALCAVFVPAGTVGARVNVHVGIGVPAPPTIVFEHEPEVVVVPNTQVYYYAAPDYDLYRYDGYWYVNRGGYWYRAPSYRGPFTAVVYERVPHALVVLPAEYHHHPFRHGGPPRRHSEHRGRGHHR